MTTSRAEIGLALAAALIISSAAAQALPGASAPPRTLQGGGQPVEAPLPPVPAPQTNGTIEVNSLGAPEGPPAGLYDATNGGMGQGIWSDSSRNVIEEMLSRLPLATPVRSIRALARRLVLTAADAPPGQAQHAFQTLRLQALLNGGLVTDAAKLAALIQLKDDPEFARVQAEAILLGGTPADACGTATQARETNSEPLWMQLRAYCYAIAGQGDMLDMTRDVMKAQNTDDKAFEILLDDILTHKQTPPGEIRDPTAVEVFLMRQLGVPLSPTLAAKFGLPASVLALRDAKNPPNARADAAVQALHAGAASAAELAAVADAQVFTPQQFANAETAAQGLPFFLGQALIRQAVARATSDDQKTKLLAVAYRFGRQNQLLPVAAVIQERNAAAVKPQGPAARPFVPAFAQALLIARQADAAERWREILDVNNGTDKVLAAVLAVQLDLVASNPGRAQRAQEAMSVLAQNLVSPQPVGGYEAKELAALVLGLCDALGEPMPLDAKAQTNISATQIFPGRRLAPSVMKRLAEARGVPGLKGEAILSILDGVGAGGPGDLAPDASIFVTRALKDMGEADAARAFAIDALLLYRPAAP